MPLPCLDSLSLFLIFGGSSILFFIVAVQLSILVDAPEFLFLHTSPTFVIHCWFYKSRPNRLEVTSYWDFFFFAMHFSDD